MWDKSSFWLQYQTARVKGWCLPYAMLKLTQQLKLRRLLYYLQKNIPFYKDLASRFEQLPIMDKSMMQEHFAQLNKAKLSHEMLQSKHHWHINQSLGTAGETSYYLYSHQEYFLEMTSILSRLWGVSGIPPKKIAVFYLSQSPYFIATPSCFKWCFIDSHQSFSQQLERLCAYSPDMIIAPSQTLCALAILQQEKKISLKAQHLVATQEVLTPVEEKLIATSFEQNVQQIYQCAEGHLGATCEYGTLHLNEAQYYIEKEWIDDSKERFIPVITTLNRYLQPLVRYRMEDILSIKSTPCACGSAFMGIERIVGRCEDTLYFSCNSHHHLKPIYADHLHLAIGKAVGSISKYQLLQHSPHQVEVKICAKNMALAKNSITQQMEKLARQFGVMCPKLVFSILEPPPLSEMFRQTKRLVKIEH
ncbi:MAG: hypothetical protein JSS07_02280 [Proteobacteria bacterium]|nr:hypothetical protein [Pseudomonadota bacterium]